MRRWNATGLAYTTVLSMLQIMYQKGLVSRDDSERAHVYKPALSKHQTQRQILGKLLHRVFEGSATELVMQALGFCQTRQRGGNQ